MVSAAENPNGNTERPFSDRARQKKKPNYLPGAIQLSALGHPEKPLDSSGSAEKTGRLLAMRAGPAWRFRRPLRGSQWERRIGRPMKICPELADPAFRYDDAPSAVTDFYDGGPSAVGMDGRGRGSSALTGPGRSDHLHWDPPTDVGLAPFVARLNNFIGRESVVIHPVGRVPTQTGPPSTTEEDDGAVRWGVARFCRGGLRTERQTKARRRHVGAALLATRSNAGADHRSADLAGHDAGAAADHGPRIRRPGSRRPPRSCVSDIDRPTVASAAVADHAGWLAAARTLGGPAKGTRSWRLC